jgi:DNA anti-recombination protein RmuC
VGAGEEGYRQEIAIFLPQGVYPSVLFFLDSKMTAHNCRREPLRAKDNGSWDAKFYPAFT